MILGSDIIKVDPLFLSEEKVVQMGISFIRLR